MEKTRNLTEGNVTKQFFRYLAPGIGATLVNSIYIIVDTIMIGQDMGEDGISALNIVMPIFSLVYGIGILFGMGAGIMFSYHKSKGDQEAANKYFTTAFVWLLIALALLYAVFNIFFEPIVKVMGADSGSMDYVKRYGMVITLGMPVFAFSSFFGILLRNDKNPGLAMVAVIIGGVANIALDYLLIFTFRLDMLGAALATLACSFITLAIQCTHFFKKSSTLKLNLKKFSPKLIKRIAASGFPSFTVEMATGVMILLFNLQLQRYYAEDGKSAIAVYGVICNVLIVAMSFFNGVGNGCQPILAANYGAGYGDRVRKIKRLGLISVAIISAVILAVVWSVPGIFIDLFVNEPNTFVLANAPGAIRIYFSAVLFMGFNLFYTQYFQSTLRPLLSLIISLLRGMVFGAVLVFALPAAAGAGAIWYVIPCAEALTLVAALIFDISAGRSKRKEARNYGENEAAA